MTSSGIRDQAIELFQQREQARFLQSHPHSVALAERARNSLFDGVPMHWMNDWPTPSPLFVQRAEGVRVFDADGLEYIDFCLGDSAALFGHSPAPVVRAITGQAGNGLASLLPGEDALWVGEQLAQRFGLPFWQVATTATDANRFAIRWARAITGRNTLLVFDGCCHGTVDETLVRQRDGRTLHRAGLLGQAQDLTRYSRVIPFNDLPALEQALALGDVAAVLCEPAMTNIGLVLPEPGFHTRLRELTRACGSLLIIDETHTIAAGPGGCTRAWGLEPDFLTLGKAIAGGVPAAVYGCTAAMSQAMQLTRAHAREMTEGHGHTGMGTSLSGNALSMRCLRANLEQVMSEDAYARMLAGAARLAEGLRQIVRRHQLDWTVAELGARCALQFCAAPPLTGAAAEAAFHDSLQQALHLYLLNRGILLTPLHNAMLCAPQTAAGEIDQLLATLDQGIGELLATAAARDD